jgi:hypothetical protein
MTMALHNAIDRAGGQRFKQQRDFISGRTLAALLSVLIPNTKSLVSVTVVSNVANYQHCVRSSLPQPLTALEHDWRIIQELVLRECPVVECCSCGWSLNGGQSNHSDLDARLQRVDRLALLKRQKVLLSLLRTQVGCQIRRIAVSASPVGKEEVGSEVELVVADCRPIDA